MTTLSGVWSRARRRIGRNRLRIPAPAAVTGPTGPDHPGAECPMCGTRSPEFLPYGVKAARPDCRCPTCGSLERHRLVWLFLALRTDLFSELDPTGRLAGGVPPSPLPRVLHVAPERCLGSRLARLATLDYLSADLDPTLAMVQMDLTDIDRADHSFDVILASHVLEHIPDDVRAMSELCRVLDPDGWALLDVPMFGNTTREDPTVTDPQERSRRFGQHDHVRMYGNDGEYERRLGRAGFDVEVIDLADQLGPAAAQRFRLRSGERLHLCRPAR